MSEIAPHEAPWSPAWLEVLRGFFRRRAPRGVDPDDLLQECLLKLLGGLDSLRSEERLAGWIFTVANNVLTDARRRPQPDPLEREPAGEETEEGVARELGDCLERMLEELSAEDAEVLRMAELEGRPQREIAERWALSTSGAKSRVQRARRRLRTRFLACCELERDRRGGVVDWRRRAGCGPGPDCDGDGGQATRGGRGRP